MTFLLNLVLLVLACQGVSVDDTIAIDKSRRNRLTWTFAQRHFVLCSELMEP